MKTFPEADVIWWNASNYYVHCPFCDDVHRHGINWEAGKLRYSHCEMMESYSCCFPLNDQGEVAYEIDKKRGRYNNIFVSHESDREDDDDVDRLAIQLAQKATVAVHREETFASIHQNAKEIIITNPGHGIGPFKQKRISQPISDCALGDVKAVQNYLETSSEAHLFLEGRDSDGQTNLIKAAAQQSLPMVSLLIEHEAEVNAAANSGRTALMEAALFGWVENVKVLLENNADKSMRDSENRQAIDFAQDKHRNKREIYDRTGGNSMSSSNRRLGYIEDPFLRDIDRQEIVRLLGGENRKSKIVFGRPPTLIMSESYSFKHSPMQDSLVLYGPIEEYPISRRSQTVARLERGGKFPSVGAMSGWSHPSVQSLRVDGRQWTDDVFYISEVVGHLLPCHNYDQGRDGQCNACHAEKQLIAYFIDRHVFLPRDGQPDSELETEIELNDDKLEEFLSTTQTGRQVTSLRKRKKDLENELFDGDEKLVGKHDQIRALKLELKSVETTLNRLIATPQARPLLWLESQLEVLNHQKDRHEDLTRMANAPPPASLTEAVILISSPPCQDCIMFKDKVNSFFGLSLQLFAAL
ncbi:uncharacterized protein N7473_013146 [Penicillium subrubescens]|uniref:Single-strand DNA deaminase toxin A-like C-terminal domain-containing protein n=1 Tax=Penicillium subrubescens TaxID=1316194 RepID=A0A1Q5TR76_9EURO|nr:uncharacterized protein N7473_013240 [Penicillium subrubescens]XP_057002273.1 uncharacterized protein N7473_013146 [Penicillium subrubescens]KAJ5873681.1 hypothetical protein N7473_013240 [Penicillium subrubescens]KAJ5875033.1 hypothetical protein N7473_013146 [Penicillium subrubescens]OKP02722.1 hypothetical protein PENSUB_6989 [Penicillium subrubescens]